MPRFILHPGYVRSKEDFDRHYIDAKQLARLYKVRLDKCIVIRDDRESNFMGHVEKPDDIHLYPRYDGRYSIFEGK